MKELAELGVGSKPLLDIAGTDTITDRSVNLSSTLPNQCLCYEII